MVDGYGVPIYGDRTYRAAKGLRDEIHYIWNEILLEIFSILQRTCRFETIRGPHRGKRLLDGAEQADRSYLHNSRRYICLGRIIRDLPHGICSSLRFEVQASPISPRHPTRGSSTLRGCVSLRSAEVGQSGDKSKGWLTCWVHAHPINLSNLPLSH
jgi:hypothetical protein